MKPRLAVLTHIYILIAKSKNHFSSVYIAPLATGHAGSYPLGLVLLVFLVQTVTAQDSHGTAEFIIRTPDQIVAAADSRAVDSEGKINPTAQCKIRRFNGMFVAGSGLAKTGSFDLFSTLSAVPSNLPFKDQMIRFEPLAGQRLERALNPVPVDLKRTMAHPPAAVFFGAERGTLFLHRSKFNIVPGLNNTVEVKIVQNHCPGPDCPNGVAIISVEGNEGGGGYYLKKLHGEFPAYPKTNLVGVAKRFVQMQIDDDLASVGPPIDILRVTKDGACWVEPKTKKDCDDPKIEVCKISTPFETS